MNKRGLLNEIWIVVILFIVFLVGMCLYWIFATAAPVVVGEGRVLTGIIQTSFATNDPNGSLNNASDIAVNTANNFLGMVEGIIYLAFFGGMIGFIAVCYYVRTYKWLSLVWVMLMIGLTVIAMVLSNAYQDAAATSTDLTNFYNTWGTNNFIMFNLPYIIAGFGVITGIILFALVAISGDEEETKEIT